MRKLIQNRKGQGTTEYIVILAIVVSIAVAVIYVKLNGSLTGKMGDIAGKISSVQ